MSDFYKTTALFIIISVFCTGNKVPEYTAAVLEFSPYFIFGDYETLFQQNVEIYKKYIKLYTEFVDIIIFPELGLVSASIPTNRKTLREVATVVPNPKSLIAPCNQSHLYSSHLSNISCAANSSRVYVVVNLIEAVNCSKVCPLGNLFYYNTNVVFDRSGRVVARYRKYNVFRFAERGFDTPDTPDIVTFDTDFGVTFGMIIRHDILFKSPALTLIRDENVNNIIYSTYWVSSLPFLTAIQLQAGWAFGNNVTLLASGYSDIHNGIGGSGIYVGGAGVIQANFPLQQHCEVMKVARIPKSPHKSVAHLLNKNYVSNTGCDENDEVNVGQEDLSEYVSETITNIYKHTLCHNDLCCNFEVHHENIPGAKPLYMYRAVVLSGYRQYHSESNIKMGVQICGIVNCLNDNIHSCGLRNHTFKTGRKFTRIEISGNFHKNDNTSQWPSLVNTRMLPLEPVTFKFVNTELVTRLSLRKDVNNLLTFAIYGRVYARDILL